MNIRTVAGWLALVGVVSAGALAGACTIDAGADPWFGDGGGVKETRTILLDHVAGKPVHVKTENGSISLTKTTDKSVTITAKVRGQTEERLKATQILTKRLDDGTLDVRVQWPDEKRQNNEGVSLEIALPDARDVNLESSNGAISIADMAGQAVLASSNASISVKNQDGSVKAESSNGSVTIDNAGGAVTVNTSNAAAHLTNVLGPVNVKTSNGGAKIALRSESTGPVNCQTSNGSIHLTVGSGFGGTLKANTSNGKVSLKGIDASQSETARTSAKVRFGATSPDSSLQTSNASIEIKRE